MKKNLTKGCSMANKNKNHNHNEIHIHMSDTKTKPRRRRKTTRKPRDAPIPYQTFQPAPVPIYTNRPQYLETTTQAQRENPVSSPVRVNEQAPIFSDRTPVPSRTFYDASPIMTSLSKYLPEVKVEPMTPFFSKASSETPFKQFQDNSPVQSPGSFEEVNPMTSPFRSSFAREAFNKKKSGSESDKESEASNKPTIPKLKKPKLKGLRRKVDVSLLTEEKIVKREKKEI